MADTLEMELKTFENMRTQLVASDDGRWALIHDQNLEGTYDTQSDAIEEGYRRFGNVPFLTKLITSEETPQNFVSNVLAV